MSIKSDKWIRRMAAEGMIQPFEAGQVRTSVCNDAQIVFFITVSRASFRSL